MRFLITIILFLFVAGKSPAQQTGMHLLDNKPWSEVIATAKTEGRMIFVDCCTSWCGPCKMMEKEVFPREKVGSFFNKHYVSVKYDMEKGNGSILKKKYDINGYPTYLFIDPANEMVVLKVTGYTPAEKLIELAKEALESSNHSFMDQRWESGERSATFLKEYLSFLKQNANLQKCQEIANTYFEQIPSSEWAKPGEWSLINDYISEWDSPVIQYVVTHRAIFYEENGKEIVDRKIQNTAERKITTFATIDKEQANKVDRKGFKHFCRELQQDKITGADRLIAKGNLNNALASRDWRKFIATCKQQIGKGNPMRFLDWIIRANRLTDDSAIKIQFADILEKEANAYPGKKEASLAPALLQYAQNLKNN